MPSPSLSHLPKPLHEPSPTARGPRVRATVCVCVCACARAGVSGVISGLCRRQGCTNVVCVRVSVWSCESGSVYVRGTTSPYLDCLGGLMTMCLIMDISLSHTHRQGSTQLVHPTARALEPARSHPQCPGRSLVNAHISNSDGICKSWCAETATSWSRDEI